MARKYREWKEKEREKHEVRKKKAVVLFLACLILLMQFSTQILAHDLSERPDLGRPILIFGYPIHPFYRHVVWAARLFVECGDTVTQEYAGTASLLYLNLLLAAISAKKYCYPHLKISESPGGLEKEEEWWARRR